MIARILACLLLLTAFSSTAGAVTSESLSIDTPTGQKVAARLYMPDGPGPHPGVLVLHTYYGMIYGNAERADLEYAEALAREGFVALVPAYGVMGRVGYAPGVVQAVQASANTLKARPEVGGKPIGVVGFSAGGFHAVRLAASDPAVKAAVGYYGVYDLRTASFANVFRGMFPSSPLEVANQVQAPVLLLHGESDDEVAPDQATRMRDSLTAAGKTVEAVVYSGAYHRFDRGPHEQMSGSRTSEGYYYVLDSKARDDAWARTLDLFRKTLQ